MWKRFWCKWFHKQDHVCWDKLWSNVYDGRPEGPIPGNWCWFCNTCKQSWHTPNPHTFPSEFPERGPWAEYQWPERLLISYCSGLRPIQEVLRKRREERDAESRRSTDESISNPAGSDRPESSGEHTGKCGATADSECPPSV